MNHGWRRSRTTRRVRHRLARRAELLRQGDEPSFDDAAGEIGGHFDDEHAAIDHHRHEVGGDGLALGDAGAGGLRQRAATPRLGAQRQVVASLLLVETS
jgi:hypothetical protein